MPVDYSTIAQLLARHFLTSAGLWLAGQGYLDSNGVQGFVGAGMLIGGVFWSWWQKRGQALAQAALAAEVQKLERLAAVYKADAKATQGQKP